MNHLANFKDLMDNLRIITGRADDFSLNGHAPKTTYAMGEVFEKKGVAHDLIKVFKLNDNCTLGFSFTNYKEKASEVLVEIGFKDLRYETLKLSEPITLKEFRVVFKDILTNLERLKDLYKVNAIYGKYLKNVPIDTLENMLEKYLNTDSRNKFLKDNMPIKTNLEEINKGQNMENLVTNPVDKIIIDLSIQDCIKISNEYKLFKDNQLPVNSLLHETAKRISNSLNNVQAVSFWLEPCANRVNEKLADEFKKLSEKIDCDNSINREFKNNTIGK